MSKEDPGNLICFNKSDIAKRKRYFQDGRNIQIMRVSGLLRVRKMMEDRRKRFYGKRLFLGIPSGGKSSLINLLQSEVMMETGSISRKIDRVKKRIRRDIRTLVLEEDEKVEDCGLIL